MVTPANDTLLQTRIHAPPLPADLVERRRLLGLLDAGRRIILHAPEGAGKSTLLGQWIRQTGRPAAWVTVEPGDGQLRWILTCVVESLRRHRPDFGDAVRELLAAPRHPEVATIRALFERDLPRLDDDLVLILDDDEAADDPRIDRVLAQVLDALPEGLHLALATHRPATAELGGRPAGTVALRAGDLRWTAPEVDDLLNRGPRLGLGRPQIEALARATDAWAAPLHLAALVLRGVDSAAERRRLFDELCNRPQGLDLDLLTRHLLDAQSDDARGFLLAASVLRRLSAAVCNAVAGRDDSRVLLRELEAARLFLIPVDGEGRWYRFHPAFARALRQELERREGSARLSDLHGRASDWFAASHPEEALIHARHGGSVERAARILGQGARPLLMRGGAALVRSWFDRLPDDWTQNDPRLVIDRALLGFITLRWSRFERELERAERLIARTDDPLLQAEMIALRAFLAHARSEWRTTCELARRALEELPKDELYLRGMVIHVLGHALMGLGEESASWRAFSRSVEWNVTCGNRLTALVAKCALGWMEMAKGLYHRSFATHRKALKLVSGEGEARSSGSLALAGLAEIHREWGDFAPALELAVEAVETGRHALGMGFLRGLLTLVRVRLSRGEIDAAESALAEAEKVVERSRMTVWADLVTAHRSRLTLSPRKFSGSAEEIAAVRRWATTAGLVDSWNPLTVHLLSDPPRDYALLSLARLLMAERDWGRALLLLEALQGFAQKVCWERTRIECLMLRGLVYAAWAAEGEATEPASRGPELLSEAIALAAPEGLVAVFSDEREVVRPLVERAFDRAQPPFQGAYFTKLRGALGL